MTAALLLLAYATAAAVGGPRALARLGWLERHPRVGILAWQSLGMSVLAAGALSAVCLALPFLPLRRQIAGAVGVPDVALVEHYATPLDPWPGVVALALVVAGLVLLGARLARDAYDVAVERRTQRARLALISRRHDDGFLVVEHPVPVVYCVPSAPAGRAHRRARRLRAPALAGSTIVVSRGAIELLSTEERRLVLAHEHRHLTARHHLALGIATTLARSLSRVPVFPAALRHVAVLVEMDADDAARTHRDRQTLAAALVTLGTGFRPETALGAGGTAAVQRVRRLTSTRAPEMRPAQWLGVGLVATVVLAVPASIAMAPAIETAVRQCCVLPATTRN